ncbi:MAG: metal-dependent hydrolase, partial [Acidobacteriota bacterium]
MDPVSHLAFGRTLVALDARRSLGAGAVAACLVGSLVPDVDAVFMPVGWDVYLRHHQGGTHSLIGAIAGAAVAAAAVRMFASGGRYRRLCLSACAGTLGHLLLDVISGADIRFLWPFGPRVALPLFAMADPWLGGILVLGVAALASRGQRRGRTAAAILLAVMMLSAVKWTLLSRLEAADDRLARGALFTRAETEWGSLTRWIVYDADAGHVESRRV